MHKFSGEGTPPPRPHTSALKLNVTPPPPRKNPSYGLDVGSRPHLSPRVLPFTFVIFAWVATHLSTPEGRKAEPAYS